MNDAGLFDTPTFVEIHGLEALIKAVHVARRAL